MKVNEILKKYSNGEISLEEANKELANAGASFYLDPDKNVLTDDEIQNGTAGLLDTGTGSLDKVQIINGELLHPINEGCEDGGCMVAFVIVGGKTFRVDGKKLIEV